MTAGHDGSTTTGDRDHDRRGRPGSTGDDLAVANGGGELGRAGADYFGVNADPSAYAVGEAIGVVHQTVKRSVDRAVRLGVMEALDDSPRPGKAPEITEAAEAWLVSLACQKAKDLGYPHELWTTRLLARHVREHAVAKGHPCMARIAQGCSATIRTVAGDNQDGYLRHRLAA